MKKSVHTREYAAFVEILRESREAAGLTQVQLADRLGVTQSFLSKCERGEARLDIVQVRNVCMSLGTTLPVFVRRLEKRLGEKG